MLGIAVTCGSADDVHTTPGIAHLNEHIHVRICNNALGQDKLRHLSIEAFTERDETFFILQTLREDFPIALEWLACFCAQREIDETDFQDEKAIVLEELCLLQDGEIDKIDNTFFAYGYDNSPYRLPIGGYIDSVKELKRNSTYQEMLSKHFQHGLTIAMVGNNLNDHIDGVHKIIETTPLTPPSPNFDHTYIHLRPGNICIPSNLESTYFMVGFPAFKRNDPNRLDLYGLSHYLGHDIDNLLFTALRKNKALLYSIHCECHLFKKTGHIVIKALSSKENFEIALNTCLSTCRKLGKCKFSPKITNRIKYSLKRSLLYNIDIPRNKLLRLLKDEIWFSSYFTLEEDIKEIHRVTSASLEKTAQTIFNASELLCHGD